MGLLRFIFAFSVLIHHSTPLFGYTLLGREPAIRGFFIISGFYMALILNEKYIKKAHSYFLFISNRFLRIYPVYWLILFLTIAVSFIYYPLHMEYGMNYYASFYKNAHSFIFPYANFTDIIRDITIIGRTDYFIINPNNAQYLSITQAYTLVLELIFYLISPFIVRRSLKTIVLLTLASLFIRLVTFAILRLHNQPLTDRFFPAELAYFLFGVLAYKLYARMKTVSFPPVIIWAVSVTLLSFTLLYPFIPITFQFHWIVLKDWIYFTLLTCSLPFLFLQTSIARADKIIGDLSYPMYISHMFILLVLKNFHILNFFSGWFTLVFALSTIVFSQILIVLVDKPLNRFRQARVKVQPAVIMQETTSAQTKLQPTIT